MSQYTIAHITSLSFNAILPNGTYGAVIKDQSVSFPHGSENHQFDISENPFSPDVPVFVSIENSKPIKVSQTHGDRGVVLFSLPDIEVNLFNALDAADVVVVDDVELEELFYENKEDEFPTRTLALCDQVQVDVRDQQIKINSDGFGTVKYVVGDEEATAVIRLQIQTRRGLTATDVVG